MKKTHPRMEREAQTVAVMIDQYCRKHHGGRRADSGSNGLCPDCQKLLAYARKRLARCPFQEGKTTCGNCPIHCYRPAMRDKIRTIMQEIGPRMIFSHPVLALFHVLDSQRKKPVRRK